MSFVAFSASAQTALVANAGRDTTVCPNTSITLGGKPSSASGGNAPYTYSWQPTTGLSNATLASPTLIATQTTTYFLTVKDALDNTVTDTVTISLDKITEFSAGKDTGYCVGQASSVKIGSAANQGSPYTYAWTPVTNLSDPTLPNPIATPSAITTYTVVITSPNCGSKTSTVMVSPYEFTADAGSNVTIVEGTTTTLRALPNDINLYHYWWTQQNNSQSNHPIVYPNSPQPDVTPNDTTTYILNMVDKHGCVNYDSVTVYVIPEIKPVFYTTFTPNGDGTNDFWYIGNNDHFPDNKLQIYNRYGLLLFSKTSYANDWDGKYFSSELPAGTYFYIYDTKTEVGKFSGTVTIIR